MKYMTKEWYSTMQKIHLLPDLQVDPRAENYSEEYFNELYRQKEAQWLEYLMGSSPSGIDDSDCEEYKKIFNSMYQGTLRSLHSKLPTETIEKVADIRVLALGNASKQVYNEITDYCEKNSSFFKKMTDDYESLFEEQFKDNKPSFLDDFNFHDCWIISSRKAGKNLVITFDNEGSFSLVKRIILKDAVVLKQEKRLFNAWWLYDEIYKTPTGYEIHVLLDKKGLIDFIVSCSDVVLDKYENEQ